MSQRAALCLLLWLSACTPSPMSSAPPPSEPGSPAASASPSSPPQVAASPMASPGTSPLPTDLPDVSPAPSPTAEPSAVPTTAPPGPAYNEQDITRRSAQFYAGDALLSPGGTRILLRGSQNQTVDFANGNRAERSVAEWAWVSADSSGPIQPLQPRFSGQDWVSHSGRDVAWLDEDHLVYQINGPEQTTLAKLNVVTGARTRIFSYTGSRSHLQVAHGKVYFATWDQGFQRWDPATGQRTELPTPYPDFYTQRLQFQIVSEHQGLFCLQKEPEQAGIYPFKAAQTYAPLEDCLQIDWRTGQSTPLPLRDLMAYSDRKFTLSPDRAWLSGHEGYSHLQPQLVSLTGQPSIGLAGQVLAWQDAAHVLLLTTQGPDTWVQRVRIPEATTVTQAQVPAGSQGAGYDPNTQRLFVKHEGGLSSVDIARGLLRTEVSAAPDLQAVEDPRLLMWTQIQAGVIRFRGWQQGAVTTPLSWSPASDFRFNAQDSGWLMPGG